MAKVSKAEVETKLHDDGAVSHKVTFANGDSRLVFIAPNHALAQHFIAHGSKAKILAAVNSVDTTEKAIGKVDDLDEAFTAGKWSLQSEGAGKSKDGALVQALTALYVQKGASAEKALDAARTYASSLSRKQQADLRAQPMVAAKIIEIEAKERGGADGLLDGFLNADEGGENAAAA